MMLLKGGWMMLLPLEGAGGWWQGWDWPLCRRFGGGEERQV